MTGGEALAEEGASRLPLLTPSAALSHLEAVTISDSRAEDVRCGRPFVIDPESEGAGPPPGKNIRLVDERGRLAAVAVVEGSNAPVRYVRVFSR